jgi:hypothetical protein
MRLVSLSSTQSMSVDVTGMDQDAQDFVTAGIHKLMAEAEARNQE